jgi:predicted ATPase
MVPLQLFLLLNTLENHKPDLKESSLKDAIIMHRRIMHIANITFHYDRFPDKEVYPFNLPLYRDCKNITFDTPVTFFIGENGTGKSTLLKAICRKSGIHIWEDTERSRFQYNVHEEELYRYVDIKWVNGSVPGTFFGSQIFHDFARFLDEWARATPAILNYFGGKSLMTQSHGESFISFFTAIYKVKGIHFLDEPETALSPKNQILLLKLLDSMSKDGHAQFIVATHSPILMSLPGAIIYDLDNPKNSPIKYNETGIV